jgi:hypothetical protein
VRFEYLERFIKYKELKRRFRYIMGLPEEVQIEKSEVSNSLALSYTPVIEIESKVDQNKYLRDKELEL